LGVISSGNGPTFDFCSVCTDLLSSLPSLRMITAQASIGLRKTTAMKVSGHKTRSMLLRYSIVPERETADALLRADAISQAS